MTDKPVQRRLAAILVADVVGYSRLMAADETGTLAALKERRAGILEPVVKAHGGRIVKFMGDGVLIEFSSAVNAVKAALELQAKFATANEGADDPRRIILRIGINLGDVIGEGSDIYGDGVNIAARLEALAEPGGICLSGKVQGEIRGKVAMETVDLGDVALKNIAEPVRAYRAGNAADVPMVKRGPAGWVDPDKQSIAVLPFLNMSGDLEQEYFSDGITEDVITELSRFKDLFVISRNSSFQFKGRSVKVQEVGRELSVKYVVEGSVRKSGNRVRITAQLIETASDNHIWAERYDRELTDIFGVQDEVVTAIAQAIPGQVSQQALETVKRKPPENLSAYEYELRGRWAYLHWAEGLASAISWYEKAVAADPNYAPARSGLGLMYAYSVYVLGNDPSRLFPLAREQISKAITGGSRMPRVHQQVAAVYHLMGERELALTHAERALALNPNDPMVLQTMGDVLSYSGRMAEAMEWYAKSATIEPHAADDQRLDNICDTYYMLEQYEKVLEIHNTYQNVPAFLNAILAAALAQLGRIPEARAALKKFYDNLLSGQDPVLMAKTQMSMCSRKKDADLWAEGYRKAGLLE